MGTAIVPGFAFPREGQHAQDAQKICDSLQQFDQQFQSPFMEIERQIRGSDYRGRELISFPRTRVGTHTSALHYVHTHEVTTNNKKTETVENYKITINFIY